MHQVTKSCQAGPRVGKIADLEQSERAVGLNFVALRALCFKTSSVLHLGRDRDKKMADCFGTNETACDHDMN